MLRFFPHHHEQKHDKPDPLSPDTLSYLPAFLAYRVDNYWREILLSDKKMVLLTKTTFQKWLEPLSQLESARRRCPYHSIAIFSLFSERRACKTSSLLAWDNRAGIQAEIGEQRRGRDSNPRYALAYTRLAGERHRPLGHLSQTPKRSRTDIGSGYYRFC